MTWRIEHGDCITIMAGMTAASIDAIVTDPPYGLGFMGKDWDSIGDTGRGARARTERSAEVTPTGEGHSTSAGPYLAGGVDSLRSAGRPFQAWTEAWAREALRVLKPGGHALVFGGTRTFHRLTCGLEDAGFDIRDCLSWLYGSGFPKSLDVSKAIDKAAGVEREVVGQRTDGRYAYGFTEAAKQALGADAAISGFSGAMGQITKSATADAERWEGWGTALKPAWEPVIVARKPLAGTVAGNVLAHGTGALNIDATRIPVAADDPVRDAVWTARPSAFREGGTGFLHGSTEDGDRRSTAPPEGGRWPANVVLDEQAATQLDDESGEHPGMGQARVLRRGVTTGAGMGYGSSSPQDSDLEGYGDSGGASRFLYVAKASSAERNAGLDEFEAVHRVNGNKWTDQDYRVSRGDRPPSAESGPRRNVHPTVKPVELMRWLVRLVTPPGGTVLDPFAGSGTTGVACALEGFTFVGLDREQEYVNIARARVAWWERHRGEGDTRDILAAAIERHETESGGQDTLFSL